jgi:hypothetical protein
VPETGVVVRLTVASTGGGVADGGVAVAAACVRSFAPRTDFLFERATQLVRGFFELVDAPAQRSAELGQLSRTENYERNHQDDD